MTNSPSMGVAHVKLPIVKSNKRIAYGMVGFKNGLPFPPLGSRNKIH